MAVTIPATAVLQPTDQTKLESIGLNGYQVSWKGPYDDLATCQAALAQGDAYDGKTLVSWQLVRIPGDWGELTLSLIDTSATVSSSLAPLLEKWSIKSCRNDVSVLAYCGSDDDSPSRAWIECWQKESDAGVARSGNYTKPNGQVADLSVEAHAAATSELMAKIEQGIESVIRFYPLLTRKRVYSTMPDGCLEKLGFIDTPTPGADAKHPTNLSTKISEYQWLKVQDDIDEIATNEFQRTESWMGIKKANADDSPWDADLYGENRWPMPYHHSQSQGGAS